MRLRPFGRRERGVSLSVFFSTVIVALIAMVGFVVDGGRQSAANRECALVAAQAARSASDEGATARSAGAPPNTGAMLAAGDAVIAAHAPMAGRVHLEGQVVVAETRVVTDTVFLSLFGISSLQSDAVARVDLRRTGA